MEENTTTSSRSLTGKETRNNMVLYIAFGQDQNERLTDNFIIASCNELTNEDIVNELNAYYEYSIKVIKKAKSKKIGLTPRNTPVLPGIGRNIYLVVYSDGNTQANLITQADTSMEAMRRIEEIYIKGNRLDGYKVTKVTRLLNIEDIIISTK